MFTFEQATGKFSNGGELLAIGYAGHGAGKNNPEAQELSNIGPIPAGRWKIGKPFDHPHLGPLTLPLVALEGTQTFGRMLFRIHGDNPEHIGASSDGCIILPRDVREQIQKILPVDDLLEVVSGLPAL